MNFEAASGSLVLLPPILFLIYTPVIDKSVIHCIVRVSSGNIHGPTEKIKLFDWWDETRIIQNHRCSERGETQSEADIKEKFKPLIDNSHHIVH